MHKPFYLLDPEVRPASRIYSATSRWQACNQRAHASSPALTSGKSQAARQPTRG